jgi:large subunit ribosomal protein L35
MPKIKTHKATAKRFKVTKTKKVVKRTAGQAHFNGKEAGSTRRKKRSDKSVGCETIAKTIKTLLNKR